MALFFIGFIVISIIFVTTIPLVIPQGEKIFSKIDKDLATAYILVIDLFLFLLIVFVLVIFASDI